MEKIISNMMLMGIMTVSIHVISVLIVVNDICFCFQGAKVRAEIYEAFENIYPILKGFRKTT